MLEWLLRKIFGIKKPESRKQRATRERARKELLRQEGATGGEDVAEKIEPSIDMTVVHHPIVPKQGTQELSVPPTTAPVKADAGPRHDESVQAKPVEGETKKVHIFNFRAWFMADPVKAALTLGLAFLSWLATYTGMLELIQANTGSLDIGSRVAIAFAVMMLMLMILYLLDSLYSGSTPTWLKPVFVFGYLFLTLISVGFGFGFYWKYLEARTEATRSAESAVSQVQVALQIGQSRLEQLQSTFAQLTTISTTKATQEREHGNSCPNSKPGEGPRMRLRDSDSQKFGYAAEYITGRATTVNRDLKALNADLKKIVSRDASTVGADGTRNKFLRALGRKLDLTIARFNTLRTDPQLRQFRDNFDKRARTTVFPNGRGGTFRCPDVQLQTALRGVVRAIDDIPEIKNPKIAAVEGSEAIVEAFRRLAVTLAALPTLKLPPSPDELRKARKQAISAGRKVEVSNLDAGLSKRDYIPLSAAVFVDLCILLISLNRRYDNFEKLQSSVASAKAGQIGNTVLDIFEAHKNKISQEMLEIFHHAEFEYGRDYYLAVPLVKGSKKALLNEKLRAKQEEISRSEHEALDHKIGIFETKLQKLVTERTELDSMKLQLTNYQNRLLGIKNQLRASRDQLAVRYQEAPDIVKQRPDIVDLDGRIARVSHDQQRCEDELTRLDRLLNGNFQRIEQAKTEIARLKEQRTAIHQKEAEILKGQLEVSAEHDLAKEARFLSNLCISLEANDILHLASIYPFQAQVRAQLKKHNSRYYAKDRHYRVYRFRKVADTQSQMVLDLIMEAARRARENEELVDQEKDDTRRVLEPVDPVGPVPVPELPVGEQERITTGEAQRDQEIKSLQAQILALTGQNNKAPEDEPKAQVTTGETPPIDHEAPLLKPVRVMSPEEQKKATTGIRNQLKGIGGLGVSPEQLSDLETGSESVESRIAGEDVEEAHEDRLSGPVTGDAGKPDDLEHPDADRSPRGMVKKLGAVFSSKSGGRADEHASAPDKPDVVTAIERPASDEKREPVLETALEENAQADDTGMQPGDGSSQDDLEVEPLVATRDEPLVAGEPVTGGEQGGEPRRRVNEESLLPREPEKIDEGVPSVDLAEDSPEQRRQDLSRLGNVRESLRNRVQNLDRGSEEGRGLAAASAHTAEERASNVVTGQPEEKKAVFTDPVVLGPGDSSQDPADRPLVATPPTPAIDDDLPSEVDNVEFGEMPASLAGDNAAFDEASEELKARNLARRFSPTPKEK